MVRWLRDHWLASLGICLVAIAAIQQALGAVGAPRTLQVAVIVVAAIFALMLELRNLQEKRRADELSARQEAKKEADWQNEINRCLTVWPLPFVDEVDQSILGVKRSHLADSYLRNGEHRPPYIRRDHDEDARSTLRRSGLLLLIGAPASGETRTAFEMAQDEVTRRRVIAPLPPDGFRKALDELGLLSHLEPSEKIVLWLDRINEFSNVGLTVEMLQRCREHLRGMRVVATISSLEYDTWKAEHHHLAEEFGRPVFLERLPSEDELRRAVASYPEVDFGHGIAAAFSEVSGLLDRLRSGNSMCPYDPTGGDCSVSRSTVAVALNWANTGTKRGLPIALIPDLVLGYRASSESVDSQHMAGAIEWATAPTVEGARLVREVTADGSVTLMAHKQVAEIVSVHENPPKRIWEAALGEASIDGDSRNIGRIGFKAHVRGCLDISSRAWEAIDSSNERYIERAASYSRAQGEYRNELSIRTRILNLYSGMYGLNHPKVATALNELGTVFYKLGQCDQARKMWERALIIREQVFGLDAPEVGATINNLGNVWLTLGRPDSARQMYERALAISERTLGSNAPGVGATAGNLGNAWLTLGRPDLARQMYERALAISQHAFGPHHPNVADALNDLGNAWFALGRPDLARQTFERALNISQSALGRDHPKAATVLNNLGDVWHYFGKLDQARRTLLRALNISERALGLDHPDVAKTLISLCRVLHDLGEPSGLANV
ncbi:tetratricopeptide repeat protein [Actinopolymorpha singaporensis]